MEFESLSVFKEPLCLIDFGKKGELVVINSVLEQISQIPNQLNIVAIAGSYRTGKSYLLNRLARSNKGFPIGSTVDSKTKGIWAWCQPHPVKKDEVLLLLDTEGLGDIKKGNKNHDNWIFTLAILLSSTLVFNTTGKFDQDTLEKWSFITEMSKHIKISESPSSDRDSGDFDLYFPIFILALRDFSLELKSGGKDLTSDEYLEECLCLHSVNSDFDERYNTPRMLIRKYFKERKCFTFETPGTSKILKKLDALSDDVLEAGFVKQSKRFTKFIFNECLPKKLNNGQPVNGSMFATLTRTYVEAIRNGKIPCIESALDTMALIENKKAVDAGVEHYVNGMKSKLELSVLDDKELSDAHQRCLKDSIALFLKTAVYDRDQKYQKLVNEKIKEEYETFKKQNKQKSEEKSKEAIAQLNKTIEEKIKQHVYTQAGGYSIYQNDIMTIRDDYSKLTGLGCKKEETILRYLDNKWVEGQPILQADQRISEREKEAEIERQKSIAALRQKEEVERVAEIQRQHFEDEKLQMQENMKQLEKKQQEELEYLKQYQDRVLNERLKEQERLLKEGFHAEAAKLRGEIEKLRKENEVNKNKKNCCIQ